jgi:hypothetical protein
VRLFLQDESRFGLHERGTRRRLSACGTKPHQEILPRYASFWLYAAVEPTTGASLLLEMPALDGACVQAFLNAFSHTYPESLNVLVWDGAPAHIAKALQVPGNVLLVRLPPYSPELNPVERLWQDLRQKMGSVLPADLGALKDTLAEQICRSTPAMLASLCGYDYLLTLAP